MNTSNFDALPKHSTSVDTNNWITTSNEHGMMNLTHL